jgi:hypothetical protein
MTTAIESATSSPAPSFTRAQWQALLNLRARFSQDQDLWTESEAARLLFLRWLVQTGRLVP